MKIISKGRRLLLFVLAFAMLLTMLPPMQLLVFSSDAPTVPTTDDFKKYIGCDAWFVGYSTPLTNDPETAGNPMSITPFNAYGYENVKLVIEDCYYDAAYDALWYKVKAAPGYTLPNEVALKPWVFQDYVLNPWGASLDIAEPKMVSDTVTDSNGDPVLGSDGQPLTVTVSGGLPEGAKLEVSVPQIDSETLPNAFDIKIYDKDGKEWQPIDEGRTVTVSIPVEGVEDGGFVNVYHFIDYAPALEGKADLRYYEVARFEPTFAALLANSEAISSHEGYAPAQVTYKVEVTDKMVRIETDSFSIYHYDGTQYVLKDQQAIQIGAWQNDNNKYYFVTRGTEIYADTGWMEDLFSWAAKFEWSASDSSALTSVNNGTYEVYTVEENAKIYGKYDVTVKAKVLGATLATYTSTFVVMPTLTLYFVSNTGHDLGIPSQSGIFMGNSETSNPANSQYAALNYELPKPTPPAGYKLSDEYHWYVSHATSKTFRGEETIYLSDSTLEVKLEDNKDAYEVTLVANFVPEEHTITWNNQGDTRQTTYKTGDKIEIMAPPEREGYIFGGWLVSSNDNAQNWTSYSTVSAGSVLTDMYGDVTLTANWVEASGISYKVEHYFQNVSQNGYAVDPVVDTLYGTTGHDTNAGSVVRTVPGFTMERVEKKTIAGDGSTVVAIYYTRNTVTITFDTNGGSKVESISGVYGSYITAPNPPTKQYYTFAGWYSQDNVSANYQFVTMPATDLTLYARWNVKKNTVTFVDGETGNVLYVINGEAGSTFEWPANPTKPGCVFKGWDKAKFTTIPDEKDTVVTASWDLITYEITFQEQHGSGTINVPEVSPNPMSFTIESNDYSALPAPTRIGYTFGGWYSNPECTGQPYDALSLAMELMGQNTSTTVRKTVYAKWIANEHYVAYAGESITATNTKQEYGTVVTVLTPPSRENYVFVAWHVEGLAGVTTLKPGDTFIMPDNAVTLTAEWRLNVANYKTQIYVMDLNGNYVLENETTQSALIGSVVSANPANRVGFTIDGASVLEMVVAADGSTVLKVYYKREAYKVTWVVDDKGVEVTYLYGAKIVKPADPTKEGHTFAGWDKEIPDTMPAKDVTITAQWSINSYNVTWNVDGVKTTVSYNYGDKIEKPNDPSKVGYNFIGWDKEIPATMPAKNLEFTAMFEQALTSLTIKVNGCNDPDQAFIFRVTGEDGVNLRVTVTEDGSVTIHGMTIGESYTVTMESWPWRYNVNDITSTNNTSGTKTADSITVELGVNGEVTFNVAVNNNWWLDGNSPRGN